MGISYKRRLCNLEEEEDDQAEENKSETEEENGSEMEEENVAVGS